MTATDIRQLIKQITGLTTGTRLNTGSMKEHLRFQITKNGNPPGAQFTADQQTQIRKAVNFPGTYTDDNTIDIKIQYLQQEKPAEVQQPALF